VVRGKQKKKIVKRGANFNDVLIKLIDSVYNLVNSGNIVGVILLYFCVQVFYITQKLSDEALDKYLSQIFSHELFYTIPLGGALVISLLANYHQKKTYGTHIESLIQTRKELIHGITSGEMHELRSHNTSGINSGETADDC
jgi:hypothetical protein|tara:strand:- start:1340 stop:1762 length:423 start_codon:yes stop_codon:yes gene_type:complete